MAPTLHSFSPRSLSTGATAGAAIGAAAAGILVIIGLVIVAMWYRSRHHHGLPSHEASQQVGQAEKGAAPVKRCRSCKRPQHHPEDLQQPGAAVLKEGEQAPHWDEEMGRPLMNKPWLQGNGSRTSFAPSFSSKRATRLLMVM